MSSSLFSNKETGHFVSSFPDLSSGAFRISRASHVDTKSSLYRSEIELTWRAIAPALCLCGCSAPRPLGPRHYRSFLLVFSALPARYPLPRSTSRKSQVLRAPTPPPKQTEAIGLVCPFLRLYIALLSPFVPAIGTRSLPLTPARSTAPCPPSYFAHHYLEKRIGLDGALRFIY
jgi:hypothetical protein